MVVIAQVAAIVTLLLPFFVALLQSEDWSANVKRWITIAICALAGAACMITTGVSFTPENIMANAVVFIGGTQLAYSAFKGIGITSKFMDALNCIKVVMDKSDTPSS